MSLNTKVSNIIRQKCVKDTIGELMDKHLLVEDRVRELNVIEAILQTKVRRSMAIDTLLKRQKAFLQLKNAKETLEEKANQNAIFLTPYLDAVTEAEKNLGDIPMSTVVENIATYCSRLHDIANTYEIACQIGMESDTLTELLYFF